MLNQSSLDELRRTHNQAPSFEQMHHCVVRINQASRYYSLRDGMVAAVEFRITTDHEFPEPHSVGLTGNVAADSEWISKWIPLLVTVTGVTRWSSLAVIVNVFDADGGLVQPDALLPPSRMLLADIRGHLEHWETGKSAELPPSNAPALVSDDDE
jgi:hypothetical protein